MKEDEPRANFRTYEAFLSSEGTELAFVLVRATMSDAAGRETFQKRWTFLVKMTDELLDKKLDSKAHALATELLNYAQECRNSAKLARIVNAGTIVDTLHEQFVPLAQAIGCDEVQFKVPPAHIDKIAKDLGDTLFNTMQERLDEFGSTLNIMADITSRDINDLQEVLMMSS